MFVKNATVEAIIEAILTMDVQQDQVVLIALGYKNKPDIPILIQSIKNTGVSFMGGVFPGVIHECNCFAEGAVLFVFPSASPPYLVKNLSGAEYTLPDISLKKGLEPKYTAVVFIDGLSSNIAGFLNSLFNLYGNSVNYIGGGAGYIGLQQKPCVFNAEGIFQDAAIVALIAQESRLGVGHGWKRIVGPIIATRTYGNIIAELNWESAFEVYRSVVEEYSGQKIDVDNFFGVAKDYPFGMLKENCESVVRSPRGVTSNGELICFSEVPENTVVDILAGDKESLLDAAGAVAASCGTDLKEGVAKSAIVIECVARSMFLKEDFTQELSAVSESISKNTGAKLLGGILTFGEIASWEGFLQYFNKTIVTGVFYD